MWPLHKKQNKLSSVNTKLNIPRALNIYLISSKLILNYFEKEIYQPSIEQVSHVINDVGGRFCPVFWQLVTPMNEHVNLVVSPRQLPSHVIKREDVTARRNREEKQFVTPANDNRRAHHQQRLHEHYYNSVLDLSFKFEKLKLS